jgi:hypothetical protein
MTRRRKTLIPPPPPFSTIAESFYQDAEDQELENIKMALDAELRRADAAFLQACEIDVAERGYFPKVMDALDKCRRRNLPLPPWLHDCVWAHLDHIYNAKKKNWKHHEEETDRREKRLRRHEVVEELLDRRGELTELFKRMGDLKPDVTYETAFDKAAKRLGEKTSTVRASYMKIQRENKSPDGPLYPAQYRASAKNRAQLNRDRELRRARACTHNRRGCRFWG